MKKLHACPKCNGRKLWVIEPFRVPGEAAEGQAVPLVPHQHEEEAGGGFFRVARKNPIGAVDLLVCDACGYSELWARGARDLVEDPVAGVRLLDSSATKAGPFR
ncbi:MAG TPA: hypothetical protein PK141_27030 [Polyangiaceae bacterium]|nr:hypothetical protein [Polyangiaceae bacterium]